MIKAFQDNNPIHFKTFKFSGGEIQVKIDSSDTINAPVTIMAQLVSSDDTFELLLLTDALRRLGARFIKLICPYLPYARQDRVCDSGEALSLKVFCDLINAQTYDSVIVWDAHSDVCTALLNNCINISQKQFVSRIRTSSNMYLVSPDAGSLKKIYDVSKQTGLPVIRADKTRDPKTGEITGTQVYSDFLGHPNMLIVDDICDGGRTFIELSKKLRGITDGKIELYVTHGIFSQGLGVFEGAIDKIYCPNVFPNVGEHKLLKRI